MSYDRNKLQRIGPQNRNGPSLFSYSDTGAALTTIDGSGYFNDAADILNVGDVIFITASSSTFGIQVVRSNTRDLTASPPVAGVVDTSNAVALGSVNSD